MADGCCYDDDDTNRIEKNNLQLTKRLQQRQEERLLHIQERRAHRFNTSVSQETGDCFITEFTKGQDVIESSLSNYSLDVTGDPGKHFDGLTVELQKLQKYLNDSTRFLSSYEVEKAQLTINRLKLAIEEKRIQVVPKKKFAFKSEKKKSSVQANNISRQAVRQSDECAACETVADGSLAKKCCSFTELADEVLSKSGHEVDGQDIVLTSLSRCQVRLQGAPSTVHAKSLESCVVLCGPTAGSIFIDNCSQCTFVVACHQLRVHQTTETVFYLHVTSRAVIEDCSATKFAPFSWKYAELDVDFQKAGLDRQRNNWNAVDDFNWLAADTPSPNWCIVDIAERISW